MLDRIRKFLGIRTDYERMMAFLSQAKDITHLEHLQREWDEKSQANRRAW